MSEMLPITGPDGKQYQPVSCEQSRPFAAVILKHWKKRDGRDRSGWLERGSIDVPLEIYQAILPAVREELATMKAELDTLERVKARGRAKQPAE